MNNQSTLASKITLLSGQHIEVVNCNALKKGIPYLTGPSDFSGKIPVASKYTEHPKVCCQKGDILLTVKGSGTGSIAIADKEYCISRQLMAIRCKDISLNFIQYLLEYNERNFNSAASGLIPGISRIDVLKLKIPSLKQSEQTAIAALLSTWDQTIEKTVRLITAKEKCFHALKQDLLTGNKRIKGYNKSWQRYRLSEVLVEHGSLSTGREKVYSVSVHKGLVNQIEHLGRSFAAKSTAHYNVVKSGDIVYTKSPTGDFPSGIIKQSQLNFPVIVSPLYGVFTPKTPQLGTFLHYYFDSPVNIGNYLRPIIQKGAKNTISITNSAFLTNSLYLPTCDDETKSIATTLNITRQEIDLLKKQANAYRRQKRGLMQKLLTGLWRVKAEGGN